MGAQIPVLQAENLQKQYGKTIALGDRHREDRSRQGVSLSIDEPGVVAILGPNGAGENNLYLLCTRSGSPVARNSQVV